MARPAGRWGWSSWAGLIVSQFITLYITPAIYLYLEDFQEHVLDRTSFFRSARGRLAKSTPFGARPQLNR